MRERIGLLTDWQLSTYQIIPLSQLTTKLRWQRLVKEFAELILKNCHRDSLILDIGGGNGLFHYFIKDICKLYVVVEPSEKLIHDFIFARYTHICQGCGENLPFKNKIFDGIILKSVLDHCFDPVMVLSESIKVLKPGGKIFILLTNEGAWYKRLFKKYNLKRRIKCRSHNFYFSSEDTKRMLQKENFKDIFMQHFDFFRAPLTIENIMVRLIPKKMLLFILRITDRIMSQILPSYGGSFICKAMK